MAVDRGQLQNVSKPNHCKNCNAMQITEGQEWYHKCLCGKGKSTNHYKVQCDAKDRTYRYQKGQCKNRIRVNSGKSKSAYQDKVLSKTAITLQY